MKALVIAVLLAVSCTVANAWPACPGSWNQVANGTAATGASGQIGEIYTADGITWQCQSKTPTPPTGGNSGSTASSASNGTGTGGNATGGNATGGNAVANGGSSTSNGGSANSTANGGSVSSKN